jgi:biotin carboxyl carrier protein
VTDAVAPPGPPDDVLGLVRDGQAKFASGEVEAARSAFAEALKLKPDDAGAKAGLERCERLLKERDKSPPPEPVMPPAWPSDDFPDSGENPEATIVDPNYLIGIARGPDPGSSSEFPEPLTVPRTPALDLGPAEPPRPGPSMASGAERAGGEVQAEADRQSDGEADRGGSSEAAPPPGPSAHHEPAYPRYVATLPGNYPDVRAGAGRPAVASPPPIAPGTPPPQPMVAVAYPQMPPGGPSAYPQFATPVGGYQPAPGAPAAMRMPMSPEQRRWMIICASVGGGCLLLGLLLGWAMFGASDEDEPAAGTALPLVAGDAGGNAHVATPAARADAAPAAPADEAKGLTPPPAAGGTASARIGAIERPVLISLISPTAGEVAKLHAKASAQVKAGAKLYTIKGGKKAKLPEAVIAAPRAGRFEVRAGEGDAVGEGDVVGLLVDPDAWLLIGDLTGEAVATAWRCEVASGDGISRSPCRLESVEHLGGGRSRIAARVATRDAGWLKGDETDLTVTVSPL